MEKAGSIILDKGRPYVVICEKECGLRGFAMIKEEKGILSLRVEDKDIIKTNYSGKKLDRCVVDLSSNIRISSLNPRKIGEITEECYCKLIRRHMNIGDESYRFVRNDIHEQILSLRKKGYHGV